MKPLYALITGKCSRHGEFTVERKPNPKAGQRNDYGGTVPKYPTSAVVCPKCRMWAEIKDVREIV